MPTANSSGCSAGPDVSLTLLTAACKVLPMLLLSLLCCSPVGWSGLLLLLLLAVGAAGRLLGTSVKFS
jgi:hypothetical protein